MLKKSGPFSPRVDVFVGLTDFSCPLYQNIYGVAMDNIAAILEMSMEIWFGFGL